MFGGFVGANRPTELTNAFPSDASLHPKMSRKAGAELASSLPVSKQTPQDGFQRPREATH